MYLSDLMETIGDMFDFAHRLDIDLEDFFPYFLKSNVCKGIECGSPKYTSGMSGEELFFEVVSDTGYSFFGVVKEQPMLEKSKEYWAGYILTYFQYQTNLRFKDIYKYLSINEIINSYYPLHEASEDKAVDTYKEIIRKRITKETNIQRIRKELKVSQKELAEMSNINLRTLQEYESRRKDINKASASTLLLLSKALNCSIYDLFEITI